MKLKHLLLPLGFCAFIACDKEENNNDNTAQQQEIVNNYANMVYANYGDALQDAKDLESAINDFLTLPTELTMTAAKEAWLTARESYGVSEAYRFSSGPIDDADGPEGNLNAWPLDEAYIDYVQGNANAGIINNANDFPVIDKTTLLDANENGGETNISIGYHAIEFLLWGQDLTAPDAKLAGQRPFTDFIENGSDAIVRRKAYIQVCADLLVDQLTELRAEWATGATFRNDFISADASVTLTNILTGPGVLAKSELAGERVFTAYENRDQEDEHSCFSDNTHRDIRLNLQGILNVLNGEYTSVNEQVTGGKSFIALLEEKDATAAASLKVLMETAKTEVDKTAIPFDFAISDDSERPQVLVAVNALRNLGDGIAESAAKLGLNINTALPE